MDGGTETEEEHMFEEKMDLLLDTEFEVSVRCPGGMSKLDLSMKRQKFRNQQHMRGS